MKLRLVLATCILLVGSFLVAFGAHVTIISAQGAASCTMPSFELSILQGPNKGLMVDGTLTINEAADGSLTGDLKTSTGETYSMLGQVNGRAVSMAFNVGKAPNGTIDRYVFGTGLLLNGVKDCDKAPFGGPAIGPDFGDSGEWNYCDRHPNAEGCNIRPTAN